MKPLEEYPTPETDAAAYYIHMSPDPNGSGPTVVNDDVSRDIERRLAACREALQKATDECLWRSDSEIPLSKEKSYELWSLAVETLALTAPKP